MQLGFCLDISSNRGKRVSIAMKKDGTFCSIAVDQKAIKSKLALIIMYPKVFPCCGRIKDVSEQSQGVREGEGESSFGSGAHWGCGCNPRRASGLTAWQHR